MKHILIITANFPPEPVTSAIMNCDLAEALSVRYRVTVLAPRPSRPKEMDFTHAERPSGRYRLITQDSYVHPESQMAGRFRESYSFGRCSAEYIRKHHEEIDFVYNDGWQFVGLYLVARACVRYGIPYLVPIQDIYPESLLTKLPRVPLLRPLVRALMAPFDRYYIRHAACVRTISPAMARYLAQTRGVEEKRFLVVANWQDETGFDAVPDEAKDDGRTTVRFMFAGNNSRQANVAMIINAFLDAGLHNAELYIMGGGNERENCELLARRRGASNVTFGSIQAVLASVEEGSDTSRILREAQCGVVTPEDDRASLTEAFRRLAATSREELCLMGKRSRHYAEQHLTRRANLTRVVQTIEQLLIHKDRR